VVQRTISSLSVRNFRLYFLGQMVSLSGTWMQSVAQAWLVLKLTGSGTALGLVVALQFVPVLLFGPLGGLVADRCDKRRLLYITQSSAGVLALALNRTITGLEGFAMGIGVAASVLLLNVLYRVGVSGDVERDREAQARDYLDEHGHWPDEEPGPRSRP